MRHRPRPAPARHRIAATAALLALLACAPARSQAGTDADSEALSRRAYEVLRKYCHSCHGVEEEVDGFRVLDRDILVAEPAGVKPAYLVPGEPQKSLIWLKAVNTDPKKRSMPPSYADPKEYPSPSEDERKVLGDWIANGGKFPERKERPFLADSAVLEKIRNHLRDFEFEKDQKNQRYLLLTNLHNNAQVQGNELASARAAASKLLNGLSWRNDIRVPKLLDPDTGVILQFDLSWYGWDASTWEAIISTYSYGVVHEEDHKLRQVEREVAGLADSRLPYIRADWFVANVSQPPLYDKILGLPDTLQGLEKKLLIDADRNFQGFDLARAGFVNSGVSQQNRMVERHESPYGAYWRSFDFNSSDLRGNIIRFPLGPKFHENPYERFAFEQAGGEVIFNLPNKLQAYMLVDAKDRRLDGPAPVTIVRDRGERAGSPQVVNGLSCIGCHDRGIIEFKDVIRASKAVSGAAGKAVLQMFPPRADMDAFIRNDRANFLAAVEKATGPFLKVGDDKTREIAEFPEPITDVVRVYLKDLTLEAAAAELGLAPDEIRSRIDGNTRLREIGLGPLLVDGGLKRQLWQRTPISLFNQVGFELKLTKP